MRIMGILKEEEQGLESILKEGTLSSPKMNTVPGTEQALDKMFCMNRWMDGLDGRWIEGQTDGWMS